MNAIFKNLKTKIGEEETRNLIYLFLIAFGVRIIINIFYAPELIGDAEEYFINSQTLENTAQHFPYNHWYERTPVYMLFLHITGQSLFIQIILSALTCVLLEKLYKYSGWIYCFYLPSIFYSNVYMKTTLLTFLFVWLVYLFRNRKLWLIIILPLVFAGFISYGGVIDYNLKVAAGQTSFTIRLWKLWRPDWYYTIFIQYPPIWLEFLIKNLFMIYYIPALIIFIRKIKFSNYEFWIVIFISLVAIFSFGNERYREPAMPFIIGFITPYLIEYFKQLKVIFATISHKN